MQNAVLSRYNDGNQIISSEVFLDSFNSRLEARKIYNDDVKF